MGFCECRNWRCESRGNCDCGVKNLKKSDLNIFLMNFCDIPNFDGIQNGYSTISEENFFRTLDEIEKEGEIKNTRSNFKNSLINMVTFSENVSNFESLITPRLRLTHSLMVMLMLEMLCINTVRKMEVQMQEMSLSSISSLFFINQQC